MRQCFGAALFCECLLVSRSLFLGLEKGSVTPRLGAQRAQRERETGNWVDHASSADKGALERSWKNIMETSTKTLTNLEKYHGLIDKNSYQRSRLRSSIFVGLCEHLRQFPFNTVMPEWLVATMVVDNWQTM